MVLLNQGYAEAATDHLLELLKLSHMLRLVRHWWLLLILREAPPRVFLLLELLLLLFEEETGASYVSFGHIGSFRRVEQSGRLILLLSTGVNGGDLWSAHQQAPGLARSDVHLQKCIVQARLLSLVIDACGAPASLNSSSHELGVDPGKVLVCYLGAEVVT